MIHAEIDAQVELLVQAGAVAWDDREKAARVLDARRCLGGVEFGPADNDLDAAFARLREAISEVQRKQAQWAELVESIEPLANDPRCRDVFSRLYPTFTEFSAICHSLSMPMDSPGPAIARLQGQLADAVRELQAVVGTGGRGTGKVGTERRR